jgi:peptide/nickel transport system permease protein
MDDRAEVAEGSTDLRDVASLRRSSSSLRRLLQVFRRIALTAATLLLVSVVIFAATQGLPSDPARAILGPSATLDQVKFLQKKLGLDQPAPIQYLNWLTGVVRLDLGRSVTSQGERPVVEIISEPAWNSAILVLLTAVISIPIAYVLGVAAAARRDSFFDHAFVTLTLGLIALPEFVNGLVLVLVFSTSIFRLLPAVALFPPNESPLEHISMLILPVVTLVLANVPYLARLVRGSMIDVLESEYVRYARLKGVHERAIAFRHALPNAIVPAIQASAMSVAWMMGGVVVIEYLFRYPGLGSTLIDAVSNRDISVVQAIVLILASWYMFFNLLADVLAVYFTPKLRTSEPR